jgi:hypothetical protein
MARVRLSHLVRYCDSGVAANRVRFPDAFGSVAELFVFRAQTPVAHRPRLTGRRAQDRVGNRLQHAGKPRRDALRFDLSYCHAGYDYAGLADTLHGEILDQGPIEAHVIYEPYGVVAAILPFNWPPIHFTQEVRSGPGGRQHRDRQARGAGAADRAAAGRAGE